MESVGTDSLINPTKIPHEISHSISSKYLASFSNIPSKDYSASKSFGVSHQKNSIPVILSIIYTWDFKGSASCFSGVPSRVGFPIYPGFDFLGNGWNCYFSGISGIPESSQKYRCSIYVMHHSSEAWQTLSTVASSFHLFYEYFKNSRYKRLWKLRRKCKRFYQSLKTRISQHLGI